MSDKPLVGIIMGSDSDWSTMAPAAEVLDELGIAHGPAVVSAHRMPEDMVTYAKEAIDQGLRVIIAGAGGAAHLPGMVASITTLPVVGVPVPLTHLEGLDSLLSIVQMPAGVPVATVGIGNARNAGLLAARIIASGTDEIAVAVREKLAAFQVDLRQVAIDKGDALTERIKNLASPSK
jgi:5-(carboxyamino)imidazole ribonucleotide mutase